jgi:hypothetical protein
MPPAAFWSAAAYAAPGDQAALGDAAHARGLYRDAAQLHKNAAASGNTRAARYLSRAPACLQADPRPGYWAVAHAALDNPGAVASLLADMWQAGAHDQATTLADRADIHADLDDPARVASLLDSLLKAGAHEQATALADRAAAHATLQYLRPAGKQQAIPVLGDRGVASLLDSMRQAGAHEQAAALAGRLPAAGMFGLFLRQKGLADEFRFGREADGTPAGPWGWEDLDLWLVPRSRRQAARGAALGGVPRRDRPARPRCASDPATASASPDRERRPPRRAQRGRPPKLIRATSCPGHPDQPCDAETMVSFLAAFKPGRRRAWGRQGHRRRNRRVNPDNRRSNHSRRLFEAQLARGACRQGQPNGTACIPRAGSFRGLPGLRRPPPRHACPGRPGTGDRPHSRVPISAPSSDSAPPIRAQADGVARGVATPRQHTCFNFQRPV